MSHSADTICALASAVGKGGVSVVRVSGSCVLPIVHAISGKTPLPRHAVLSDFSDITGNVVDSGLLLFFAGPHSFTGEDVCEFHCHGSPVVVDLLLQTLVDHGARLARPGEFSERAFLNGKIDLTQAEAIADLIDSCSAQAARHAVRSLQGDFSKMIAALAEEVIAIRSYVEAAIDFSDEEIDFLSSGQIASRLETLDRRIDSILESAKTGSVLREGLNVVIAGEPNVGKSTLLNALCGSDIAIVTPIAGTTRDMIRHELLLDGFPLHITDTAGLRESEDPVEAEGIRRARVAISNADHVLLLVDAKDKSSIESLPLWQELNSQSLPSLTIVFNKIDLLGTPPSMRVIGSNTFIELSASTGSGLDTLKQHLLKCAGVQNGTDGGFMARRRHLVALKQTRASIRAAISCLRNKLGLELIAEELRLTQLALDEIVGKFSTDDLLGTIFSSFCIGK